MATLDVLSFTMGEVMIGDNVPFKPLEVCPAVKASNGAIVVSNQLAVAREMPFNMMDWSRWYWRSKLSALK